MTTYKDHIRYLLDRIRVAEYRHGLASIRFKDDERTEKVREWFCEGWARKFEEDL